MQKGQYYTVFQLLQGAVIAALFLVIVWGIVSYISGYIYGTDVATISVDVLKSAYSARDTGKSITRTARLNEQFFTAEALRDRAGLLSDVKVAIICDQGFCEPSCPSPGCARITLEKGDQIQVCSSCSTTDGVMVCFVVIGESSC
jgi:hypothetical protein